MTLVLAILLLTFLFVVIAFASVNETGIVVWMLRLAVVGCIYLNVVVLPWLFFNPSRALRAVRAGCLFMLPLMAGASLHTYGVPVLVLLFTMYYSIVLQRKEIDVAYMLRYTERWRVVIGYLFWLPFILVVMAAFFLSTIPYTKDIFPIEGGAIKLWQRM